MSIYPSMLHNEQSFNSREIVQHLKHFNFQQRYFQILFKLLTMNVVQNLDDSDPQYRCGQGQWWLDVYHDGGEHQHLQDQEQEAVEGSGGCSACSSQVILLDEVE